MELKIDYLSEKLKISGKKNGILTIIKTKKGFDDGSFLVIDTKIRISLLNYCSGGSDLFYFIADVSDKINERKPVASCCEVDKIEPFTFKEGMIQSILFLGGGGGLSFLTLGGITYSIPTSYFTFGLNPACKVLDKNEIIAKIESLFGDYRYFYYEEKKANEENIKNFNLLISPKKLGWVNMNGIIIKGKTLNGETTFLRNKNIYYQNFCLIVDETERVRICSKREHIAKMRFEHPRVGSYKTQYFKSGMIGVKIPDGSLIMKDEDGRYHNDEILTPSGKIYGFFSWGTGSHSGYSVNCKHYASEEEKVLYFQKGYPVRGITIMDKAFGVTNNTPTEID